MSITGDAQAGTFSTLLVTSNEQVNGNLTVLGTLTNSSTSTNTLDLADGSASAPSLSFTNDNLCGLYRDTSGGSGIGFATNGNKRLKLYDTAATFSVPIQTGTNNVTCNGIVSSGAIESTNGSASTPSFSFASDATTGLYREAAGTLSVVSAGSEVLRIGGSQVTTFQPLNVGTNSLTSGSIVLGTYAHTIKDIVAGSFSYSSSVSAGGANDNQTQSISNVASAPVAVLLTLATPSDGTHFWDRTMLTACTQSSSYNSGTGVYTLNFNLVNTGAGGTSGTITIFYVLFC